MSTIGKDFSDWGSELLADPLKVVQLGFAGYDLGLTVADTTFSPDTNIKDVMYQQRGTKAADHVLTGADWLLSTSLGEIKTEMLKTVFPYLVKSGGSSGDDSGLFVAERYQSFLENYAGALKIAAVNAYGVPSTDVEDLAYFYYAIPIINGDLINWGADTQRALPIQFRIKIREFTAVESSTHSAAYGYYGDPTNEDVPAVTWPDLVGPVIQSVTADDATTLTVTFDENASEATGPTAENAWIAKVNGTGTDYAEFVAPTTASDPAGSSAVVTLTFPASSFAAGDTITLYLAEGAYEDTESTPNENGAQDGISVTNNVT